MYINFQNINRSHLYFIFSKTLPSIIKVVRYIFFNDFNEEQKKKLVHKLEHVIGVMTDDSRVKLVVLCTRVKVS